MTKISLDISDPEFKMADRRNSMCVGGHTYTCLSPTFTDGELNQLQLEFLQLRVIERKVGEVGGDD